MLPAHLFRVADVVGDQRPVCQKAGHEISFCAGGAQLHQNPRDSVHGRTAAIAILGGKKPCIVMVQCPVQKLKSSPAGSGSLKGKVMVKVRGEVLLP